MKLALAVKIRYGRAATVVAPGSLFATRHEGDVEEETMTITDPLAGQVADLHGIARDIQST